MRQRHGNIHIGRLKVIFSRISTYFGYINFIFILMTFYSVKGYKYGSVWLYVLAVLGGFIVLGALDYFFIMPCEYAFMNEQTAKHQNPIYDEIKIINQKLKYNK